MIPVTLKWKKPLRDVVFPEGEIDWKTCDKEDDERRVVPLTDEFEDKKYEINLEKPKSVAMANCKTATDFRTFINRYGFPWNSDHADIWQLMSHAVDMETYLEACSAQPKERLEIALRLRERITIDADIHFSRKTGNPELALTVSTLFEFMCLEVLNAYEVGARFQKCEREQCNVGFLTGTGTGRRNTSRFCGQNCRQTKRRQLMSQQRGKRRVSK
ncbi:hypothetical protein [Mesorhizobium sp. L2C067A000]|uniref:hypothetical protein n=1 Tax=Mesorhizobium sp. L2C067A000 TaxID=1287106 RepID=UPI0012DE1C01|nr:hypothetical protein [Mesorhizobium sp. L2C067A000]